MYPLLLFAQELEPIRDAWEPSDNTKFSNDTAKPQSIYLDIANSLISFYKKDISNGSISRCPFVISCSSFCKEALNSYGIWGLVLFIDRYFYRENFDAFSHYKLIGTKSGVLKLDDTLFLYKN